MRVITGKARGKRLYTLEGMSVRPTSEKVKEAVFSAIQFEIEGRNVLDLFAGSGQLGIEAISRGAKGAVFVDSSKQSLETVKKNLAVTDFSALSKTVLSDYSQYLLICSEKFDIAFLDPPYNIGILSDALKKTERVMNDGGTIICEHPPEVSLPETVGRFAQWRSYKYGKICVTVYKKESN